MAVDYADSLRRLRSRRLGIDRDFSRVIDALNKSESYERRVQTSATKYALGAMAAVDPEYTQTSYDEGQRVIDILTSGLAALNRTAEFEFQGSVPLNVHIRGVSDIDLLVLDGAMITYNKFGPSAHLYHTVPSPIINNIVELRNNCEDILERRFYGAKVDKTGSKSIKLSGGAFKRQVDVVPSHWSDRFEYQASGQKHDREVYILDKSVPKMVSNLPFFHMKKINDKDLIANGGAKMAIRLLKNLMEDSSQKISLSSYDVASMIWHCPDHFVKFNWLGEMSVLVGTEQFVADLSVNTVLAKSLRTPDNTRDIFDTEEKLTALNKIAAELSKLVKAVEDELIPLYSRANQFPLRTGELIKALQLPA